jgi:hypothetical protein
MRKLGHRELHRQLLAAQADAGHDELLVRRLIEADAAEIDGELVFERADHHLEDARQILPLADRASDLLQQVQPFELRLQLALRPLLLADVVEQDGDLAALRPADPIGAHLVVAPQRLGFGASSRIRLPCALYMPVCFSNAGLISRKR